MFCDLCVFYYTLKVYKVKTLVLNFLYLRVKPLFFLAKFYFPVL